MTASTKGAQVTLTVTFDAPVEKVFQAWVDEDDFAQWYGPETFHTPRESVALDPRPGGSWKATIVSDDDESVQVPFGGEYKAVDRPTHLAFTQSDEADAPVCTVDLVDLGDGRTELTFVQPGLSTEDEVAELTQGWTSFFNRLTAFLAK
ncbi:SRPBCC domain-containing protein [Actinokineospora soli]|uniref:SRPBCC domain-containing protein n=1 Tax=Actinokineospora soli TaxID=1048753 RepID=A0ABW2TIL9_9PSEU